MFMNNIFLEALPEKTLEFGFLIMLLGLAGVFSVIVLLYLVTKLLGSISGKKKNDKQ